MAAPSAALGLLLALADGLPDELPDVLVSLGEPIELPSDDTLALGVTDPGAKSPASSATSTLEWSALNVSSGYDESGEVALAAWSFSGSSDMAEAATNVYSIMAAVLDYIRANYTNEDLLGVPGLWELRLASTELQTFQIPSGCTAYLLFRLAFQATI